MITASYAPDQELARDGALTGLLPTLAPTLTTTPMPTLPPLSQLNVQVISVATVPGRITVRLRIFNEQRESMSISPDMIWLALGYVPIPDGPHIFNKGLVAFDLLSGQAAELEASWVWEGEPFGVLGIGDYLFKCESSLSA